MKYFPILTQVLTQVPPCSSPVQDLEQEGRFKNNSGVNYAEENVFTFV